MCGSKFFFFCTSFGGLAGFSCATGRNCEPSSSADNHTTTLLRLVFLPPDVSLRTSAWPVTVKFCACDTSEHKKVIAHRLATKTEPPRSALEQCPLRTKSPSPDLTGLHCSACRRSDRSQCDGTRLRTADWIAAGK